MMPDFSQEPHISDESLQVIEEVSNPSRENYFSFAFVLALLGATIYGLFYLLELNKSMASSELAFASNSSDLVNAKCNANGTTFSSNTTNSVLSFVNTECRMFNSIYFDRLSDNSTFARQLNITLTCLEVLPSLCHQWYQYDVVRLNSGRGLLLCIVALPFETISLFFSYFNSRHRTPLKEAIKDETLLDTIRQELQSFKILLINKTGRGVKDTLKQYGVTLNETGFSKLFNLFSRAESAVLCSQRINEVTEDRLGYQRLV